VSDCRPEFNEGGKLVAIGCSAERPLSEIEELLEEGATYREIIRSQSEAIATYRYALRESGCMHAHDESHDLCCVCADCIHAVGDCGCLRCVALCDFEEPQ
jgi:hypothetical protein